MIKLQLFDQNHGLNPLEKCKFGVFFKLMFSYSRKACFLYKTSKIVFSRFIFTIFYMGIQGVGRRYKGFKGVKLGDNGLQGVTRAYRVLRKNIFLTRTSPDTFFFGVFCIKIKVE